MKAIILLLLCGCCPIINTTKNIVVDREQARKLRVLCISQAADLCRKEKTWQPCLGNQVDICNKEYNKNY